MGSECGYVLSQAAYMKLVLHSLKPRSSAVNGLLIGCLDSDSSAPAPTVQIIDAVPLSHSLPGLLPSLELALLMVEEHFGAEGLGVVGYYHANERADDSELPGPAKNIGDQIFRSFPRAAVLLLNVVKMKELPKRKGLDPVVQMIITGGKNSDSGFCDIHDSSCQTHSTFGILSWPRPSSYYKEGFSYNWIRCNPTKAYAHALAMVELPPLLVPCLFFLTTDGFSKYSKLYSRDSSKGWHQSGSDGTSCQLTLKEPSANTVLLDYIASEKWQEIVDFDDHLDDISKDWLNPDLFK